MSVTFQATLNLSAYFIKHCLAVLCKFLGDFWERDILNCSKDSLNLKKTTKLLSLKNMFRQKPLSSSVN